eukprot:756483-Hanusia_phi.AAC.2
MRPVAPRMQCEGGREQAGREAGSRQGGRQGSRQGYGEDTERRTRGLVGQEEARKTEVGNGGYKKCGNQ